MDCYATEVVGSVSHADFVEAFYTTAVFKLERLILRVISRRSTDVEAGQLARGDLELVRRLVGRSALFQSVASSGYHGSYALMADGCSYARQLSIHWDPPLVRFRCRIDAQRKDRSRRYGSGFPFTALRFTSCTRAFSCWQPDPGFLQCFSLARAHGSDA